MAGFAIHSADDRENLVSLTAGYRTLAVLERCNTTHCFTHCWGKPREIQVNVVPESPQRCHVHFAAASPQTTQSSRPVSPQCTHPCSVLTGITTEQTFDDTDSTDTPETERPLVSLYCKLGYDDFYHFEYCFFVAFHMGAFTIQPERFSPVHLYNVFLSKWQEK